MYKYVSLMACLIMSGCAHQKTSTSSQEKNLNPHQAEQTVSGSTARLEQCRAELTALRAFDTQSYTRQKTALETSVSKTSQYALMKSGLSADIQQVMDSVYQAQLARRCQDIHAELFRLMLAHADKQP